MVQRVANPYMMQILINLFAFCEPRNQILVLKVLQNILYLGIPAEIFDNTVEAISDRNAQVDNKVVHFKFKSQFLRYFFAEMYQIRDAMFSETNIQSAGAYEVS